MKSSRSFDLIEAIDRKIEERHLLKHPFYRAWTEGRLSRESLALYAKQYYQHVKAFPEYLRRLAGRTEGDLRETVADNLQEELHPAGPHPKLWRDFAASLGVEGTALDSAEPLPGIEALIATYSDLAENGSPAEAVAALYAYEAQVPEIAAQKIDGLRSFYGITEPRALRYFSVHQEADVRHRAAWREWLARQPEADQEAIVAAAERGLKSLWGALDAVYPEGCAARN
jgi:pyrroloquinoline-quinone synthase